MKTVKRGILRILSIFLLFVTPYQVLAFNSHVARGPDVLITKWTKQNADLGPNLLKKPIYNYLIVIDAGHGGKDYGTYSEKPPIYLEKSLNLATARMLRNFLQQMGYQTLMTRTQDEFISLEERAAFANNQKNDAKIFVSLHYNSCPNPLAEGIEVYYYSKDANKRRVTSSKHLGDVILDHVCRTTQAKSRGVRQGNFAVIRNTTMPAVLIEGGFLTNEVEVVRIKDAAYLKRLAWGVAQGIHLFAQQELRKSKAS